MNINEQLDWLRRARSVRSVASSQTTRFAMTSIIVYYYNLETILITYEHIW